MRTFHSLFAAGLFALAIGNGCTCATPDAGFEAVLTKKPILGSQDGVDPMPVKAGREFVALTTSVDLVDMRPQLFHVKLDDFFTKDGVPLDFQATIRLQITSSVRIVAEFGQQWYAGNVEPEFIRAVRDAVKKHDMNEVALNVTAAEEIDKEVTDAMTKYIAEANLPIKLMNVTLGRASPPDAVKTQRVETASQEQRQNTEKQRKLAEDQRREAELSRAKADNAYREGMELSPSQFISLEQIKMLHEVCGAAGKGGCTFLIGAQGVTPTLDVRENSKK